ncbi:Protein of unknown function [Pyronema omphalodes CBS 100304]|uniref:Uncharacterized protein n=1 Tax=Pyronema omphalodes (strain CBS 100304) TaxID=1076935 RepID=U4L4U1_PYROM|nr:Protein of unknown function [Pyronema omphalodes CBS 100304]
MNKLHTDISADPNGYLWIAKKIRSKRLYHDAFVHIVGQWDTIREEDNVTLSDEELLRVYSEYTRINQIGRKLDLKFLEMMSSPDPSNATLKNREIFTSFSHYRTDRSRAFYKSLSQATPDRTQEEMWIGARCPYSS